MVQGTRRSCASEDPTPKRSGTSTSEQRAAAPPKTAMHGIYFLMPLFVEEPELLIECSARESRFEMRSSVDDAFMDATTHCSGAISVGERFGRVQHSSLRVSACQHVGERILLEAGGVRFDGVDHRVYARRRRRRDRQRGGEGAIEPQESAAISAQPHSGADRSAPQL